MRRGVDKITAHWSKPVGKLEKARIEYVPNDSIVPDADWRLLPNIEGIKCEGFTTQAL